MIKFIVFFALFSGIIFTAQNLDDPYIDISPNKIENIQNIITKETNAPSNLQVIFSCQAIPNNIYQNMLGNSIPLNYKSKVNIDTLSYLQISYWGFDGNPHIRRNDCKFQTF